MRFALSSILIAWLALLPGAATGSAFTPEIDHGFQLLYQLRFEEARAQFHTYQEASPDDPMGAAAEAASFLFQEFQRQGVLTSEFFLDDKKLLGGVEGGADPLYENEFLKANQCAQQLALQRLRQDPRDANALLAMTLATGMRSNYAGLIQKQHLESLRWVREADRYARKLLAVDPNAHDAELALGASNYILGCLPPYKKFFLWFGGITGDRRQGMKQLELAATQGHYLRPYAKILLALAALREGQPSVACKQLHDLNVEFPQNSLFVDELAKVNPKSSPCEGL